MGNMQPSVWNGIAPKILRCDYRERDAIRTWIKYQIEKSKTKCIIGNKTGAGTRYPYIQKA